MLLVEFDEHFVSFDMSVILNVARIVASMTDAYVDFFGFMEMVQMVVAYCQTDSDIYCASSEVLGQSYGAGSRYNKLPDKEKRSPGKFEGF